MSHFMRRHKKIIFWSLVILVVPTFIYWGANVGGSGNGRDGQTPTIVGQVGPISITARDPGHIVLQMHSDTGSVEFKEPAIVIVD